jgi:hypothetical protein
MLSVIINIRRREGTYDLAEEINRRALNQVEKMLDPEHPDMLVSSYNLANILQCQGKYNGAEMNEPGSGREPRLALNA